MVKINLLAEGKRAAVRKARPTALLEGKDVGLYMLAGGLLVGILAALVWWWVLDGTIERKQAEIGAAEAELARLESTSREVEEYKVKKAELERKIGVINDLKLAQRGPVRVMDQVSRALPELLWLDRLRMAPDLIEIEGRALNTNAVANFIENLDRVPEFEEPTLQDATEQPGGTYKFVVNFRYSFGPPAAPAPAPATGG
ncbi:MAG TPA: PilN domain-containing protein [Thermoanaerobaculia bacterium]|nr:PilN domain-containing protein [Thermoanaerobaculia bacterium]